MSQKFLKNVVLVIFLFFAGFFLISQPVKNLPPQYPQNIKYIKIAGQSIYVDLALTPLAQAQGLSGKSELVKNHGMLFVFENPGRYSFWMKDMNFSIDMVWISEAMKVVYIKKDATPQSFPESFGPQVSAKYVLEVASGFSDKNNLKEGDSIFFTY